MQTHYLVCLTQGINEISLPFGGDYSEAIKFFNAVKGMVGINGKPAIDSASIERVDFTSRESTATVVEAFGASR